MKMIKSYHISIFYYNILLSTTILFINLNSFPKNEQKYWLSSSNIVEKKILLPLGNMSLCIFENNAISVFPGCKWPPFFLF